ncbi:MAG: hypothetical protein V7606_3716, partial [Burkholderiales bacterium]
MMTNTTTAKRRMAGILPMALLGLTAVFCQAAATTRATPDMTQTQTVSETLSARQQALVPIAAFAAAGDISRLSAALNQGLDAG